MITRLYEEAILVPYQARLSVFCRENFPRAWIHTIRIYCMTDDKAEKVIQSDCISHPNLFRYIKNYEIFD